MSFTPATSISCKRCISTTECCLRDIFIILDVLCYYVAWPCDLDLWPFDLESVSYTVLLVSDPQFLLSYDFRLLSYELMNLITFPLSGTVTAHAPCHMTYHRGGGAKMVHILEIPDPNLPIHSVSFRALRRRLSHVIGENSVYPIVKATKFTAHAQYHVTWA